MGGDHRKACKAFEQLRRKTPDNPDVLKMLARMYHRLNQPDKAIECALLLPTSKPQG